MQGKQSERVCNPCHVGGWCAQFVCWWVPASWLIGNSAEDVRQTAGLAPEWIDHPETKS